MNYYSFAKNHKPPKINPPIDYWFCGVCDLLVSGNDRDRQVMN